MAPARPELALASRCELKYLLNRLLRSQRRIGSLPPEVHPFREVPRDESLIILPKSKENEPEKWYG